MTANHYWIWPRASVKRADGTLRFKTSGVDRNEVHWTSEESFPVTDPLYPALRWVYQNRAVLPSLLERMRVQTELHREAPLTAPPDGVYAFVEPELTTGWSEVLRLPITILAPDQVPPTLRLLTQITGGNCFLFLHGMCEAAISVGREATDELVTPTQALLFLQPITDGHDPTPNSRSKHRAA